MKYIPIGLLTVILAAPASIWATQDEPIKAEPVKAEPVKAEPDGKSVHKDDPPGDGTTGASIAPVQPQLVLVPSNTWLYSSTGKNAHRFRIRRRLPSMKRTYKKAIFPLYATARPKRVMLFRLVEPLPQAKGWAHLKPVGNDYRAPNGCDFLTPGGALDVDLYVRAEKLLPTLKEEFQANYEDGTGLGLKPGVVIRSTKKKGRFIAETPYMQIQLSLPKDATSFTFEPMEGFSFGKSPAWAKGPIKLKVGPDTRATLFGVDIGLQAEPKKHGYRKWLLSDTGSCARVTGFGRYRPLGRDPKPGFGGILGTIPDDALIVAKGVNVFWPDGKPAGRTAERLIFEPGQEKKTKIEDLRCMKKEFFADSKQVLCFPKPQVKNP